MHSVLDTAQLSVDEGRELTSLVDALESAQPPKGSPPQVPDSTRYDLTVVRGSRVRRLTFDDTTVPPEVRPLLDRLIRNRAKG